MRSSMAEQRVHPGDAEQPNKPKAPMMPVGAVFSKDGTGAAHFRQPRRRRGCLCRCVCWTVCLLLLLVVLVGIVAGALYLIYDPKVPKYSVERISISGFSVAENLTVSAGFSVTVKATNPNRRIGIYYLGGSHLRVWFKGTELCQGRLPEFYQGHRNTTVLQILMTGQSRFDDGLLSELKAAKKSGSVPIDFRGKVPVRLKLGSLKLFKFKSFVRCHLVISNLAADQVVSIKRSDCNFKFRL